jgi:hypothetical protein
MTTSKKFLFLVCIVALMSPLAARATGITAPVTVTLTLESTPNSPDYPYDFKVKQGSNPSYDVVMSCLSFNRRVSLYESWSATAEGLEYLLTHAPGSGEVDGSTMTALEEDAYLDSLYGTDFDGASNDEIQTAIWDIVDPSAFTGSNKLNSTESTLVLDAGYSLTGLDSVGISEETSSFYSQFTFYYPTGGDGNNNEPQQFMEYTPTVTPEPSSLLLLGTGMAGLAWIVRRRMLAARV